ncbi:hypothetical protein H8D36_00030 [archaeon]|nr:hypothetical protein [archaeon]
MDEFKCPVHGLTRETTCSWCSTPICKQCIEASYGKKYCPRCYSKVSKNTFARTFMPRGDAPTDKVTNIDPTLTEEDLKKRRQMLEIKDKAKKIMAEEPIKRKKLKTF